MARAADGAVADGLGVPVDWADYKRLCDTPEVCSRFLLEQTLVLVRAARPPAADEPAADQRDADLCRALEAALAAPPLDTPEGYRGPPAADMFVTRFTLDELRRLRICVERAIVAGRVTPETRDRGLGGFAEAWRECELAAAGAAATTNSERKPMTAKTPTDVVLTLIDAFNRIDLDAVVECFSADAVYHNMPIEPVTGRQAIRAALEGFMGSAEEVLWELPHIAETANGAVLTERVDKFRINGQWIGVPVMGVFEVQDGRITAWRDYFDMAQFQQQFAKAMGG